jgi:hypothetical protein
VVHLYPRAIDTGMAGELGFDGVPPADQLDHKAGRQFCQGLDRSLNLRLWGVIPPHGVESDADHAQASSTSTIFLPR